jgi:hypothetical protein
MKKILFLGLISVLFLSCRREGIEELKTDNANYNVELLFEVDGCKVYRFWDEGYKFFTTCDGSVSHKKINGKHRKNLEIQTVVK